jgi:hypothetical protein
VEIPVRSRVSEANDSLSQLEKRLGSDPSVCLDYLEICERASSLCLLLSDSESLGTCAAIKARCQTNLNKYCGSVLDAGVTPGEAGPGTKPVATTFAAVADTYVEQSNASTNFGGSTTLYLDQAPDQQVLLRFSVAGLAGPVSSAKLRLYVINPSSDGPALYRTSDAWQEHSVTWNTRPSPMGAAIKDLAAVSTGWLSIDVTSAVTGNGTYSFLLIPTSTDGVDFSSKETSNQPQLIVLAGGAQPPPDGGVPAPDSKATLKPDQKTIAPDGSANKPDTKVVKPDLPSGPPPTGSFRFVAWSDTQGGESILSALSQQAKALTPAAAFTIFSGDVCESGPSTSCLTSWKNAMNGGSSNGMFDIAFVARGNHDGVDGTGNLAAWQSFYNFSGVASAIGATNYQEQSPDLNYSFDYQNAHVVSMDCPGGDASTLTSAQFTWLDGDLAAAEGRGLTHAFIFWHGPEYYVDGHVDTAPQQLLAVLNKHAIVSATFHGHEHLQAWVHMDSTRYSSITRPWEEFIVSGAGADLYGCNSSRAPNWCNEVHGFATVDVSGKTFTVAMYAQGSTAPQKSFTFTK